MRHEFRIPFVALTTLFFCVCVHELGHAVAACFSGGRVVEFSLFSLPPHVRTAGQGTIGQESFRAAAGSGLFLTLYLLIAPFLRRDGSLWSIARQMASWFAFVELAGWSLASLSLTDFGGVNDAQRFLRISGVRPAVVIAAVMLIGLLALGAQSSRVHRAWREMLVGSRQHTQ